MAGEVFIMGISCLRALTTRKGEILLLRRRFSLNKVRGQTSEHTRLTHRFVMVS